MARIGPSKGTKPEMKFKMILVRNKILHSLQVRWGPSSRWTADFRIGDVLVDVHGFHWHHPRSKMAKMSAFWKEKLKSNIRRDRRKRRYADQQGITYVVIWSHRLSAVSVKASNLTYRLSRPRPPAASSTEARSSRKRSVHRRP